MKKFFSLVLALVMALSLTTVAWGAAIEVDNYADFKTHVEAGDDVKLTASIEGGGIVIDKSVVIDFNGFTLTFTGVGVGSGSITSNGFQILESAGSVTLKNGTLKVADSAKGNYYILVQNYADLTVTNMVLDGTNLDKYSGTDGDSYALSVNNGTTVINGGTAIIANDDGDKAYAFDTYDKAGYAGVPTVTVDDAVIDGNVEASGGKLNVEDGTFNGEIKVSGTGAAADVTITGGTFATDVSAYVAPGSALVKDTNGNWVAGAAVTMGDKFDLYLADSGMATALKLGAEDVSGLSFNEVDAKTNQDGSGRVAYIAANNGQFFVKTTAPTTTSYAVTYAGKTDVLYYVNLGPAGAGYYEYSDTCDVVTEFGVKCGQCAFTNTAYTANPLKTYFVLADDETVCESKAAVADPQYNFLVNGVVYSGTIVGKVVDHSFTANDFDYNATLKQNVPTSAICTKCLMVSTSIYLDGKVPAGKAFYDIANATAYSVVAEAAAGTVVTPSTDKVTSADTFDAGIAMYVGMSVMAAAGSAVVIGKKRED